MSETGAERRRIEKEKAFTGVEVGVAWCTVGYQAKPGDRECQVGLKVIAHHRNTPESYLVSDFEKTSPRLAELDPVFLYHSVLLSFIQFRKNCVHPRYRARTDPGGANVNADFITR